MSSNPGFTWKYVFVPGEWKKRSQKHNSAELAWQLANYIPAVFPPQPTYRFVQAFSICRGLDLSSCWSHWFRWLCN